MTDPDDLMRVPGRPNRLRRHLDGLPGVLLERKEHPMNEALIASLREEREKVWAALQAAGGRGVNLATEIDELDERIQAVQAGEPRCRFCGSDSLAAWYPVWERQGITLLGASEDGEVRFEYDGITKSGDADEDEEYTCLDCGAVEKSLEYLAGLTERKSSPVDKKLDAESAAGILFGPDFSEEGFDPEGASFASGANVCEWLASFFGFTDEDYRMLAARRRARKGA